MFKCGEQEAGWGFLALESAVNKDTVTYSNLSRRGHYAETHDPTTGDEGGPTCSSVTLEVPGAVPLRVCAAFHPAYCRQRVCAATRLRQARGFCRHSPARPADSPHCAHGKVRLRQAQPAALHEAATGASAPRPLEPRPAGPPATRSTGISKEGQERLTPVPRPAGPPAA
ncbi:hypothetical protein NDU88_006505 [Pleurodeles waltl]|uniref:Uncharacterized protein n=1 Tax=Pleurodeles waltl TaxID=8319 RepID=A0AAV7MZF1_PLEWA|nr:hypothetical protein NDU88_006505 [Pleurodeles waltl]